jgi:hypothetical protein
MEEHDPAAEAVDINVSIHIIDVSRNSNITMNIPHTPIPPLTTNFSKPVPVPVFAILQPDNNMKTVPTIPPFEKFVGISL